MVLSVNSHVTILNIHYFIHVDLDTSVHMLQIIHIIYILHIIQTITPDYVIKRTSLYLITCYMR